ncbi:hypothetical protein FT663_01599 [Candidozyma haemuli var. vulneris]|uniref:Uncharacterized protein n=1 Tax=Candidozyma haemuli TaxID=45357 RepID=A0A2V1B1M9_9ASCO|nr:hypothetical protein CXQ85_004100 [[Candida] haemuloni]KAF3994099.1 hypothetical protein FT663_01599 [[Candida] haemuloni var. vulneris]KAF3994265.1 hypothetical protein FT662_00134 [[Candida] haemuloni var. vulneris]PVH23806.1 hypothetical protein CXQ85_004100 [[Candida] haemuloni]
MKLSTVIVAAALSAGAYAVEDTPSTVTTTFHGSTDTHRYGRFDKTSDPPKPTNTGTERYGRFDKTADPVTTTIFITDSSITANHEVVNFAASNGTGAGAGNGTGAGGANGSESSTYGGGAAVNSGAYFGVAGAIAAGLFLI